MTAITMDREALAAACGSKLWVSLVAERSPFATSSELHVAADEAFDELSEEDWLEAFAHHPRIGDVESLRERFAASGAQSEVEQAGVVGADDELLAEVARGNREYEQRFGFVFLVRAAGRSVEQVLELQRERLGRDRADELATAAEQQREITHLRLERAVAAIDPVRPREDAPLAEAD